MSPYPARFRERALAALTHGTRIAAVADTLAVDPSTLSRWRTRQQTTGSVSPTPPPGRARLIGPGDAAALQAQVDAHPDATLAEHAALWKQRTGQLVSQPTMNRAVTRLGITRKKRR